MSTRACPLSSSWSQVPLLILVAQVAPYYLVLMRSSMISAVLLTLSLIQPTLVSAYPLPALELTVHALDLTKRDINGLNSLARRAGGDSEPVKTDKNTDRNAARREARLKMKAEDPEAFNRLRASQAKWNETYLEKLKKEGKYEEYLAKGRARKQEKKAEYLATSKARKQAKKAAKAAQSASQQPMASGSGSGQPQESLTGMYHPPLGQPAAGTSSHPAYGTLPPSTQYYPPHYSSPVPPISTNSRGQQYRSDWPDPFAYPAASAPMTAMGHPQHPPPNHAQSSFSFDPLIGWYASDFDFSPYLPK